MSLVDINSYMLCKKYLNVGTRSESPRGTNSLAVSNARRGFADISLKLLSEEKVNARTKNFVIIWESVA